jgi:hypothetical protein
LDRDLHTQCENRHDPTLPIRRVVAEAVDDAVGLVLQTAAHLLCGATSVAIHYV